MDEFFEGPEKRIECVFTSESKDSFLDIPKATWESILEGAQCSILSSMENDSCRAFLLSESSLFVWSNQIMLKTCGRTRIFECIPPILAMGKQLHQSLTSFCYSHRKFFRPGAQPSPHRSVSEETQALKEIIQELSFPVAGSFQAFEREDYCIFEWKQRKDVFIPDCREMSMTHLTSATLELFDKKSKVFEHVLKTIDKVQHVQLDPHWFSPQGYSLNVLGSQDGHPFYLTLHLTPQAPNSYLSLETNLSEEIFQGIIKKLFS